MNYTNRGQKNARLARLTRIQFEVMQNGATARSFDNACWHH